YNGIEDNCDERGFVWSVCGWAGTQRYSVVWSGDQYGSFEYIRFHIPTFIGSGLSGYSLASSDLDGIFGGSGFTYLRDLQWKTFIPVTYAMSGWANNDKHPWNYGPTTTDINRKYLKLKMRLTPYMYTYCNEAYETGTPVVRAMVLEFPEDPVTLDKTTQYQFMSGEWMLVAPVYKSSFDRDSIYFPEGKWIDYWDGTVFEGNQFLSDYYADFNTCPVFIKEGAIIPMYPEMLYDNQLPKDPLTFDIYPSGYSSFELYEDDGLSREHRTGAFSKTLIESDGPAFGQDGNVSITVGTYVGEYSGKPTERSYMFEVHVHKLPDAVLLNGQALQQYFSLEELQNADDGWFYDADDRLGIVHVKTQALSTAISFEVVIDVPVKIGENTEDSGLKVFPNPTKGKFRVSTEGSHIEEVKIFDMGGNLVEDYPVNIHGHTADLDLSSVLDGIYVLEVKTNNGLFREKLVCQK
ncbi:MAG: TIM-barrel domain-containing protein, partial [Bacteroidota bacterium]